MSDFDNRLRTALTDLGHAAEERVRPAGAAGVPAAGRRRRRAVNVAASALVLVLAGGATATAARLGHDTRTASPTTAGSVSAACHPVYITVFLTRADTERRLRLEAVLAGPEFASVELGGSTDELVTWDAVIRCADDFPALKQRIEALPVYGLTWSDPSAPPPAPPWSHPSDPARSAPPTRR